jgi:hypothetical protein
MKRIVILLFFMLSLTLSGFAQEPESARPLTDTEVVRRVAIMDIEGQFFYDVVVTMKSTSPDYLITDKFKVKVTITDSNGKKVWKKTFKNAFLYVFSNGQVQVGKRNFDQILIQKSSLTGDFLGKIREKEGIF